jgi:hypothetical protein
LIGVCLCNVVGMPWWRFSHNTLARSLLDCLGSRLVYLSVCLFCCWCFASSCFFFCFTFNCSVAPIEFDCSQEGTRGQIRSLINDAHATCCSSSVNNNPLSVFFSLVKETNPQEKRKSETVIGGRGWFSVPVVLSCALVWDGGGVCANCILHNITTCYHTFTESKTHTDHTPWCRCAILDNNKKANK